MQHQEFDAPEALRDFIKCFWHTRMDLHEQQSGFEVLPDGNVEIVFHFGSDCRIFTKAEWRPLPSPSVMGLPDQPVVLKASGHFEVIGVRCFPWTVFGLLEIPAGKEQLSLADHPVAQLHPLVSECLREGRIHDAVVLLQDFFLARHPQLPVDRTLSKAGSALCEMNGTLPVGEVAAAAHTTVRTLERKFKQSSGFTVKDVSGLMRFEQVRNYLWLHPDANLAALAEEMGYTDQSHLSREFKRYSGTTPAAFARKHAGKNAR